MRWTALLLLLGWAGTFLRADDKIVQTFDGTNAVITPSFKVEDRWEIRWDTPAVVAITVLSPDGAIVAGAAGTQKGSLYQPKGGTFTLLINRDAAGQLAPWHVAVVELGPAPAATSAQAAVALTPNYLPPSLPPAGKTSPAIGSAPQPATATDAPAPPPASSAAKTLTEDQSRAVVLVKGDIGEGTGFLVKTSAGPAVVTNLHVISANSNIEILTSAGVQVKILGLKGASDRDLAMFSIQDDHYAYFSLAANVDDTLEEGDEVITPGNSEGGEVMLNTRGKVLGIGPDRIEIDNPIFHGNSGGPIFQTATGKVVGVVTGALVVNNSDALDRASFANKNSAISKSVRYFGLRLDTVPKWETYDWNRFLGETTFLQNFHDASRCLDSFLNGARYEKENIAVAGAEGGPPSSHYFTRNEKIQAASEDYRKLEADADKSQRLDATRELVMNLEGIADADMDTIQNSGNFYSFDQMRAAQEVKYRKNLRTQIEAIENKISDLDH